MSVEDVRLSCRRNASLSEFITKHSEQLRAERGGGAGGGASVTDGQPAKQPLKSKGKRKEKNKDT